MISGIEGLIEPNKTEPSSMTPQEWREAMEVARRYKGNGIEEVKKISKKQKDYGLTINTNKNFKSHPHPWKRPLAKVYKNIK